MRSPLRRALAALRFRRLLLTRTFSRWGDTFNTVALVLVVFRLTGSGLQVGATADFEIVPIPSIALGGCSPTCSASNGCRC
ncbi:MAG: hypothetical protein ACRDZ8_18140 [Acidimicrobiales bacterium]